MKRKIENRRHIAANVQVFAMAG